MKKRQKDTQPREKIRRQYFTAPLIITALSIPAFPYAMACDMLLRGRFVFESFLPLALKSIAISALCTLILATAALLNRNLFGRTVCELSKAGIHYNSRVIPWQTILSAEYECDCRVNRRVHFGCLRIYTTTGDTVILHAPLCLLRRAKKHCPRLVAKLSTRTKIFIATLPVLVAIMVPAIFAFG